MEYTSFNNIDEIKDKKDLKEFFNQLGEQARSDKQKKQFTKPYSNTRQALLEGWQNLKKEGKQVENKRRKETIKSNKVYVGEGAFKQAKKEGHVAVTKEGKQVYKSVIIVLRDKKGKVIKDKELKKKILEKMNKKEVKIKVIKK